jgi:hypothetical protein
MLYLWVLGAFDDQGHRAVVVYFQLHISAKDSFRNLYVESL